MRFLGALMVVMVHYREFIYPDSILAGFAFPVVDFFFMLSGFFCMSDAAKASAASEEYRTLPAACDSIQYTWQKAKNLFSLYLFAQILMFVVRTAYFSAADTLRDLFHFKWEFFMLHMLGLNYAPAFGVDYLLPPAWFVSSLMIALVPFYFFARRYGKAFSGIAAPLSMALIYAFIIQSYNTLDVGNEIAFGMIMVGNLRAFAGLSLGAFIFHISEWVRKSFENRKWRIFFNFMDVISWVLSVSLFIFPGDLLPKADMIFWMIPFSFLLLNGINDIGPISSFLNHHGTTAWGKLGKLSMYVFLLHFPIIFIWENRVHLNAPYLGNLMVIVITIVFSGIVMYIRERR